MMLSDPRMTGPAITHVLPGAVVYDMLFCPLVLWLVVAAPPRPAPERRAAPAPSAGAATPSGRACPRRFGAGGGILGCGTAGAPHFAARQVPARPVRAAPQLRLAAHPLSHP